jgi:hypothetical protein
MQLVAVAEALACLEAFLALRALHSQFEARVHGLLGGCGSAMRYHCSSGSTLVRAKERTTAVEASADAPLACAKKSSANSRSETATQTSAAPSASRRQVLAWNKRLAVHSQFRVIERTAC